jgi:hypothetical protein
MWANLNIDVLLIESGLFTNHTLPGRGKWEGGILSWTTPHCWIRWALHEQNTLLCHVLAHYATGGRVNTFESCLKGDKRKSWLLKRMPLFFYFNWLQWINVKYLRDILIKCSKLKCELYYFQHYFLFKRYFDIWFGVCCFHILC